MNDFYEEVTGNGLRLSGRYARGWHERCRRGACVFGLIGAFALAGFLVGCANPGPVKSPSLLLPALVTDLSAERVADTVVLTWTTPTLTTDGGTIVGPMVAEICREVTSAALPPGHSPSRSPGRVTSQPSDRAAAASVADPAATTTEWPTSPLDARADVAITAAQSPNCGIVHRVAVAPGRTTLVDTLTPALEAEPVALMTYRIAIYSQRERTAGYSANVAYAAAGLAPTKLDSLRIENVEPGVQLEWLRAARASASSGSESSTTATRDSASAATSGLSASKAQAELLLADLVQIDRFDMTDGAAVIAPAAAKALHPAKKGVVGKAKKPGAATVSGTSGLQPNEVLLRVTSPPVPSPSSGLGSGLGSGPASQAGSRAALALLGGALDTSVELNHRYRYTAERVRTATVGGHGLEIHSAPSVAVFIERRDLFAPHRPTGLEAVAGELGVAASAGALPTSSPFIDLSWEPNTESDLAGYLVERQLIGSASDGSVSAGGDARAPTSSDRVSALTSPHVASPGAALSGTASSGTASSSTTAARASTSGDTLGGWVMLTPRPSLTPSFRDAAVVAGRRYRYRVIAVDATGNRSAASEPATEAVSAAADESFPPAL